ncbi:uncharacterized protein LOC132172751 isoform X2 [Corylus avellana]|nr:uncharacterized protein LOC132172751 isoform X2 [Corylus avellana]XP_059440297.1 uncharacterized protein LOC132172751 isoform X2 [Corylus avellana]XP_059440298.1 uncharacterized protein LOC132172751 isoform X2 [Corylus avellana]
MIKAMCRLSCIVCDKINEQRNEGSESRAEFKNIEQLRGHLFHRHRLFMCSLCLEGRKIFICEQKLYNKSQLNRHIKTGDSEVDGNESERGGFMGHPICEFCQNPFYGDNELYLHMSTEHFTCHICQRRHPGQYEYYEDYGDLEIHFRQEHYFCEDETCLAKKFVVFSTESELKRHNAMEHGGNMSRFKRNATLQIPTRFQYWRSNEQDRQGRRRGSRLHSSDNQLSLAIQTTFETANVEQYRHAILSAQAVSNDREAHDSESIINSFEPLAIRESETPSRDSHASARNTTARLEESYFPPLPVASSSSRQKYRNDSEELSGNTMAARLRHQNNGTVAVLNSSLAWPAGSHQPSSLSNFPNSSKRKPAKVNEYLPSTRVSPAQSRLATADVVISSNYRSSSRNSGSTSQVGHSALIPNLVDTGSFETSVSSFPPLSASQTNKTPSTSQPKPKLEHVHPANKSLVEKIRAALEFDENKYAAFKKMSAEYRQGLVDTGEYLASIYQFGLSPHVLELARLCPDPQKQKELVETYNFNMRTCGSHDNSLSSDDGWCKNKRSSKKGKKKCGENGLSGSEDALAYRIISSARNLQSNYGPSDGEVEVLSTDGNRIGKGKSKIDVDDEQTNSTPINQLITEPKIQDSSHFAGGGSKKNFRTGGGGNKQGKKISKFLRNRLGNNATSLLDYSDPGPNQTEEKADEDKDPPQGLQVCGAWRNGGGRRIVAITQREHKK